MAVCAALLDHAVDRSGSPRPCTVVFGSDACSRLISASICFFFAASSFSCLAWVAISASSFCFSRVVLGRGWPARPATCLALLRGEPVEHGELLGERARLGADQQRADVLRRARHVVAGGQVADPVHGQRRSAAPAARSSSAASADFFWLTLSWARTLLYCSMVGSSCSHCLSICASISSDRGRGVRRRGEQAGADGDGRDQGEQTVGDPAQRRPDGRTADPGRDDEGAWLPPAPTPLQPTAGRLARGKMRGRRPTAVGAPH